MIEPHGGTLVDRIVDGDDETRLRERVGGAPTIDLSVTQYHDLINLACGRYSPLDGFLSRNDFQKVVRDRTLEDGTVWPLPIILDVNSDIVADLEPSQHVSLRSPAGELVGSIEIDEIYKYNAEETAANVFGSIDEDHPGVRRLYERDDFLIGGTITVLESAHNGRNDLAPAETRVLFEHNNWDRVVGFQTRNAPHRAHEYLQKAALESVDGLFIQPKIGDKKAGDYLDEVITGAYDVLIDEYYPSSRVALSTLPSPMRYAGPREAMFDALVRKNHGCTHFIVGRDHAGVGDYYGEFAAQEIFADGDGIGIEILPFDYAFFCHACDGMASRKTCPHDADVQIHPSGSGIRELLGSGEKPSKEIMRPEVAEYLMNAEELLIEDTIGGKA